MSRPLPLIVAALLAMTGAARSEPLVVEDATGARMALEDRVGAGPALVHFWATWCAPCLDELPELDAALEARPDLADRIVIVSVDTKSTPGVSAFLTDRLGLQLETVRVVAGRPAEVFGITAYPTTVWLDAGGTVSDLTVGALDWTDPDVLADIETHLDGGSPDSVVPPLYRISLEGR